MVTERPLPGGGTAISGGGTPDTGGGTPFRPVPAEFNHCLQLLVVATRTIQPRKITGAHDVISTTQGQEVHEQWHVCEVEDNYHEAKFEADLRENLASSWPCQLLLWFVNWF